MSPPNGEDALHDIHALSDEQILEIEPEVPSVGQPLLPAPNSREGAVQERPAPDAQQRDRATVPEEAPQSRAPAEQTNDAQAGMPAPLAPPKWLADRMNDPWNGEEARNFWQGIQQEREEAAAYRGVFAKPDDARAAADRSRQLEQIDGLYFGSAGKSPEEAAAAREQLAQTLLQQDPAAFREMVFAGLRALEKSNVASRNVADDNGRLKAAATNAPQDVAAALRPPSYSAHLVGEYAAFEKAANEDLDRDVGGAIARVLEQALPVAQPLLAVHSDRATDGAQARVPVLHDRLAAAVRKDVEAALKNDRQLAEQVAQIISGKRPGEAGMRTAHFDDASRAQVVRLIGERAKQLVPGAARRVLNDWTQTALAAHRARTQKTEAAASRREVEPASAVPGNARAPSRPPKPIDYRKLSDEQILDM